MGWSEIAAHSYVAWAWSCRHCDEHHGDLAQAEAERAADAHVRLHQAAWSTHEVLDLRELTESQIEHLKWHQGRR